MNNLKNINILVPNTGASQLSFFVIKELNSLTKTRPEIDSILFYENKHKNCLPTNFSVMQISEAWGQSEAIIATTLSTARKLQKIPARKKIFYVWDLEWIRDSSQKSYEKYSNVYGDKSLTLVARSEHHKLAIENAFNRAVEHVVSDFNMQNILEILQ